jgi:lipopolysaccharide biosynthesis glycosyltransferase
MRKKTIFPPLKALPSLSHPSEDVEVIDIVYIGTSSYAPFIRVSAESAIRRAKNPDNVRIHVVTDEPNFPDIGYDVRLWTGEGQKRWHGTDLVWSRIDFPLLFPECDWIISCDADTLWLDAPEELYSLRDENLIMQGSVDCVTAKAHPVNYYSWWKNNNLELPVDKSYCCGLMVLNLKKMRELNFAARCNEFLLKYPDPPQCEQTVMCYMAKEQSGSLPPEWGVFSFWHTTLEDPKLIHYAVDLPWQRKKINSLISDVVLLWWLECERVLGLELPFQGYRGCANRFDYLWRRGIYILIRPFSGLIDRIGFLRSHLRNAKGFSREKWRKLVK